MDYRHSQSWAAPERRSDDRAQTRNNIPNPFSRQRTNLRYHGRQNVSIYNPNVGTSTQSMGLKKRRMVFIPEINPDSFVLFFEKGDTGRSWSIRDYSKRGMVTTKRPGDLQWDAGLIHRKAVHSLDAPTVRTEDLEFWHNHTRSCNARFLAVQNSIAHHATTCPHCNRSYPSSHSICPHCVRTVPSVEVKKPLPGPASGQFSIGTVLSIIGKGFAVVIAVGGGVFFARLFGFFAGLIFATSFLFAILSPHNSFDGNSRRDRRQPQKHRWLTNRLKPRKMHFGPRRLF
jgi:hypothetical protein